MKDMNNSLVQFLYYDVWVLNECPLVKGYPLLTTPWPLLFLTGKDK